MNTLPKIGAYRAQQEPGAPPAWISRLVGGTARRLSMVAILKLENGTGVSSRKTMREAAAMCEATGAKTYHLDVTVVAAVWSASQVNGQPPTHIHRTLDMIRDWCRPANLLSRVMTERISVAMPEEQLERLARGLSATMLDSNDGPSSGHGPGPVWQGASETVTQDHCLVFDAISFARTNHAQDDELTWLVDHLANAALLSLPNNAPMPHKTGLDALAKCMDGDGIRRNALAAVMPLELLVEALACERLTVIINNANHLSDHAIRLFSQISAAANRTGALRFEFRLPESAVEAERFRHLRHHNTHLAAHRRGHSSDMFAAAAALDSMSELAPYLKALSVFDGPFSLTAAADLLSMTGRQALDVISSLETAGLISRCTPVGDDRPLFHVPDPGLRNGALLELSAPALSRLHGNAAAALRSDFDASGDDPLNLARVAKHLTEAGSLHDAAQIWSKAGDAYMARIELKSAAQAYAQVKACTGSLAARQGNALKFKALLNQAKCELAIRPLGDPVVEDLLCQVIRAPADTPQQTSMRLDARWHLFVQLRSSGRMRTLEDELGLDAARTKQVNPCDATMDDIFLGAANTLAAWHRGTPDRMRREASWTIAAANALNSNKLAENANADLSLRMIAAVHGHMSILETLSGHTDAARAHRDKSLEIAHRAGDPTLETHSLTLAALSALWSDDQPASTAYAIAAKAIAQRYNLAGPGAYAEIFALYGRQRLAPEAAARAMGNLLAGEELKHAAAIRALCFHVQASVLAECDRHADALVAAVEAERLAVGGRLQTYWPLIAGLRISLAARDPKSNRDLLSRQLKRALGKARAGNLHRVVQTLESVKSQADL